MTPGGLHPLRVGARKLMFFAYVVCTDANKGIVPLPSGFALPHQQEIERMSSFRDQLGDDWLRYQHHLDGSSSDKQPRPQTSSLPSDGNVAAVPPSAPKAPEVLPPSQHSPGTAEPGDVDGEQDTESTLQWPGHSPQPAESTLEDSVVDGPSFGQTRPSAESKLSAKGDSEGSREEEEEDLGGESLATCAGQP